MWKIALLLGDNTARKRLFTAAAGQNLGSFQFPAFQLWRRSRLTRAITAAMGHTCSYHGVGAKFFTEIQCAGLTMLAVMNDTPTTPLLSFEKGSRLRFHWLHWWPESWHPWRCKMGSLWKRSSHNYTLLMPIEVSPHPCWAVEFTSRSADCSLLGLMLCVRLLMVELQEHESKSSLLLVTFCTF